MQSMLLAYPLPLHLQGMLLYAAGMRCASDLLKHWFATLVCVLQRKTQMRLLCLCRW